MPNLSSFRKVSFSKMSSAAQRMARDRVRSGEIDQDLTRSDEIGRDRSRLGGGTRQGAQRVGARALTVEDIELEALGEDECVVEELHERRARVEVVVGVRGIEGLVLVVAEDRAASGREGRTMVGRSPQ